ncbi:MAG TPA: redoxin domain-containing protein [Pirellulales bacterium]|nr:redoxin domain-containing protein [Pirellulales bacterium]
MKLSTIFVIAMFGLSGLIRSTVAADLKVGEPAPDFELKGSDGQLHHLADYKDKQAVVLAWFPAAFTPGCTAECKSLKDDGDAIKKFDAVYFAISVDPMEKTEKSKGNKAFAESLGVDYPILSDPEQTTANAYGVLAGNGRAHRWTFYIGKDGKIAVIDKKIDTAKAGEGVAAKLKDLGVPEKK